MKNELTTPIGLLSLLNSDKNQRKSFCTKILEQIEEGEVDPIQVHVFLKNIEAIFKTFTDEKTGKEFSVMYKKYLMDEVEKNGKSFEKYNAKFQVKDSGVKYNYDNCNDELMALYSYQLKDIEEKIAARQEFLKALPDQGIEVVDNESGECKFIFKPSKTSTTTISVNLS